MKALLILSALMLTGCGSQPLGAYMGEPKPYVKVDLVHHIQPWMDWMLKDDRKDWMGSNPRIHGELGLEWKPEMRWINTIQCPAIASGTSIAVGAPFKPNGPELYWAHAKCGIKIGGW